MAGLVCGVVAILLLILLPPIALMIILPVFLRLSLALAIDIWFLYWTLLNIIGMFVPCESPFEVKIYEKLLDVLSSLYDHLKRVVGPLKNRYRPMLEVLHTLGYKIVLFLPPFLVALAMSVYEIWPDITSQTFAPVLLLSASLSLAFVSWAHKRARKAGSTLLNKWRIIAMFSMTMLCAGGLMIAGWRLGHVFIRLALFDAMCPLLRTMTEYVSPSIFSLTWGALTFWLGTCEESREEEEKRRVRRRFPIPHLLLALPSLVWLCATILPLWNFQANRRLLVKKFGYMGITLNEVLYYIYMIYFLILLICVVLPAWSAWELGNYYMKMEKYIVAGRLTDVVDQLYGLKDTVDKLKLIDKEQIIRELEGLKDEMTVSRVVGYVDKGDVQGFRGTLTRYLQDTVMRLVEKIWGALLVGKETAILLDGIRSLNEKWGSALRKRWVRAINVVRRRADDLGNMLEKVNRKVRDFVEKAAGVLDDLVRGRFNEALSQAEGCVKDFEEICDKIEEKTMKKIVKDQDWLMRCINTLRALNTPLVYLYGCMKAARTHRAPEPCTIRVRDREVFGALMEVFVELFSSPLEEEDGRTLIFGLPETFRRLQIHELSAAEVILSHMALCLRAQRETEIKGLNKRLLEEAKPILEEKLGTWVSAIDVDEGYVSLNRGVKADDVENVLREVGGRLKELVEPYIASAPRGINLILLEE